VSSCQDQDIVVRASDTIRVVINIEQAYDVLDELASNPRIDTFVSALHKITRLVDKVHRDLRDKLSKGGLSEECEKSVSDAVSLLERWRDIMCELEEYVKNLEEREQRIALKRFAAYALAPDKVVTSVIECLEKRREQEG
jgi:glycyl-tRNA synthetase beta subunit